VVAVGARTPLGLDACQTGMLLRAGFASMAPAPLGPEGEDVTVCHNPALCGTSGGARAAELGGAAIDELLDGLSDRPENTRVRLYLAFDADADDPDGVAAEVLAHCKARFRNTELDVSLRGAGGPPLMVAQAVDALRASRADVCIVGGVHCDYDAGRIARLIAQDRLYSDDNMDALMPGESAAFIALAKTQHDDRALGHVCGIGNAVAEATSDNHEPSAPARGATQCVRHAVAALARENARAGWVLSDIGFESWRLREQQTVLVRHHTVLGAPYRLDNPAQRIGDMGAAALPLCAALVCEGFTRGYAASPIALITAGSDSGERGALVLRAPHA
jgi:3-oxoacyl-[acyl-carrier-protein] synthase-1